MMYIQMVTFLGQPISEELMQKHREWLYPQFERGTFVLSGVLEAVEERPPSAIAVFEAEDWEAAKALVADEPFFRAGAVSHVIVPFIPSVVAASLDGRFGDDAYAIAIK